jgi:hypothetical protein
MKNSLFILLRLSLLHPAKKPTCPLPLPVITAHLNCVRGMAALPALTKSMRRATKTFFNWMQIAPIRYFIDGELDTRHFPDKEKCRYAL